MGGKAFDNSKLLEFRHEKCEEKDYNMQLTGNIQQRAELDN
jgi:hypothetical protein